jgi:RNA polymerase sigma-70 factor, ECF subfamily
MAQSIPLQDLNDEGSLRPVRRGGAWTKIAPQATAALTLGRAAASVLKPPSPVKVLRHEAPVLKNSTAVQTPNAEMDEAARLLAVEVRKAQQGDAFAMTELIENNRAWVRGIAYTVLGDAHLAEDAAQEVCVRVVKHLRGLDTPEAFRPWVYRMTRNVALSMAQRRERSPQPLSLDAEQMQEGLNFSRTEQPGAALEEDERVSGILETISRLPDIYREVLVLKHVQDLSYTEMSTILGVSVKSLEVRLVRARKLLQDRLGRRFDRGRKRDPREEKE